MYTFSEAEYKWCPQCAGNIRLEAAYCRFCHKPIENRLLKTVSLPPFVTVRSIREWLPNFAELKTKLPVEFLNRLETAAAAAPKQIGESIEDMRRKPGGENICPHEPPEANVVAILTDLFLALYAHGESINQYCDYPQMKVLEITPQEIAAELELRNAEYEKGHRCSYCREFILENNEECRFCEGADGKIPVAVENTWEKPVNPHLLKDVLVYEAAWRKIHDEDAVPTEILASNSCSEKEIEQEILRQRNGSSELPMTRFTRRMIDLGLATYFSYEQLSMMALSELGSALDSKKVDRSDEALIVYEHALRRTEGNDELMSQRASILTNLSTFYSQKKDDSKSKLYRSMAHECSKFGMNDEMKAMMDKSNESLENMFKGDSLFDMDPEKRLAALEKDAGAGFGGLGDMAGKIEALIPGMGDFFASLTEGIQGTVNLSRLMLQAQVAEKNGNLQEAESKYNQALPLADQDRITGTTSKIAIMNSLAEIKKKSGDMPAAEKLLNEAMEYSKEYAEAHPSLGKTALLQTLANHASYLRDVGKYEESELEFQQALKVHEEVSSAFIKEYGGDPADYASQEAEIKEKYLLLLKAQKRDQDANRVEAEVAQLRKTAEAREAERKERRDGKK